MTGTEYEDWCAVYLKKLGFHKIRKTKTTGDQGIDLIAEKKGLTYGFQCKYYSSKIGNTAIQQAYAGMTYYGLNRAAVITNQTFTHSAYALAEETGVLLFPEVKAEKADSASVLIRIAALGLAVFVLFRMKETVSSDLQNMQAYMTGYAFILLACLSAFFASHYGALFCTALCTFVSGAVLIFVYEWTAALIAVIFGLICLIRAFLLLKSAVLAKNREEKAQLRQLIEETEDSLAAETGRLLSETLNTPVKAVMKRRKNDGSVVIECSVRKEVDDVLALAEYTLNQYADYERENVRYKLQKTDDRKFTVYLKRKEEEQEL